MLSVVSSPISGIPDELKRYRQWMGTRFARRAGSPGKIDKPPYKVRRGEQIHKADKNNPDNHATFEEALDAFTAGKVDAIGIVVTEDDPLYGVDLDNVVNKETGEIHPAASEIIHAQGTYTEISSSGEGIRIIGKGKKPEGVRCKRDGWVIKAEVYDQRRFLVLTGRRLGAHTEVEDRQGELHQLCQRLWPKQESSGRTQSPPNTGPVDLEDAVLLEHARTARSGPKFHRLYDLGDTSGYSSHSNADYALLNMLVFWTAGDRDRIIRLFEASALYRQKGKHRNYAALSVDNALASYVGPFYKVRLTKEVRNEEEEDPLTPYLALMLDPSAWTGRRAASAYKAFTAAVILAAEDGIIDDAGDLRIGCDLRRLAEAAGTSFQTLSRSALPYLMQEMKLLKWKRGKGRKASVLVLKNPARTSLNNKVSTHYIVRTSAPPKDALETLRLLIRMRYGYAKSDALLKLGMPAMFVVVALASSDTPLRGQTVAELADRTGRRKSSLEAADGALKRLKAAGIVQQTREGLYRLTSDFAANYERVLEHSGITYAEREQRRRHARDREARDAKLQTNKWPTRLRGKEQMSRLLKKQQEEANRRGRRLGEAEERKKPRRSQAPPPGAVEQRIARLVREGMAERFARDEVLGRGWLE
jgi:putative DNA primase/helicase